MTGIAALAAAAAVTQRIPGGTDAAPAPIIRVVNPTMITPGSIKVTSMPGHRPGQGDYRFIFSMVPH